MTILDLSAVPHHCCNHGIDALHKAMAEEPDDLGIWHRHDNPWLSDICEQVTAQGQAQLLAAQSALFAALGIEEAKAPILAKATTWTPEQIDAAVKRLHKPLERYTPADWVLLVDAVLQTHLAPTDLVDAFAWRAQLAGRLDALHKMQPDLAPHETLLALVTRANITHPPAHLPWIARAWDWAKARVGLLIVQLTDNLRARLAGTIVTHIEAHGTADRGRLEQQLRDTFGQANRDWRRIAVTEATEAANTAYLQSLPDGAIVERIEQYATACSFCKSIHGKTFTWSTVPLGEEYGWTHVWPGKSNVGRSFSPRKQTPEGLVERTESELWWPASGAIHPHCRGRWLVHPSVTTPPGGDPDFTDWLREKLKEGRERLS